MSLNDYEYDTFEIMNHVKVKNDYGNNGPSIGMALEHLISTTKIDRHEFKGDIDGIDALCYHLDAVTCTEAIKALQAVLNRFDEEYTKRS